MKSILSHELTQNTREISPYKTLQRTGVEGCSNSSYLVEAFLGLFPSTVVTSCWLTAVVVLAVVVTAVVYEVGVAVTDPVPVTVGGTFTLLIVWVVTKLPPLVVGWMIVPALPPFSLGGKHCVPVSGLLLVGLVLVRPVVETASVLILGALLACS